MKNKDSFIGTCTEQKSQYMDNVAVEPSGYTKGGTVIEFSSPQCCAYQDKMNYGQSCIDRFFILIDIYKCPCNPFDGKFDRNARGLGDEPYWKFKKVERDIFDIYRKFLLTGNINYLNIVNSRM